MKAKPRHAIRFKPDLGAYALIDLKLSNKVFQPKLQGLILNESYTGCALVLVSESKPEKGIRFKIKVGNLHVMKAELMWVKHLEENLYKVGIHFLE